MPTWIAGAGLLLGACVQQQGTPSGALVGRYAITGALIENTCGQTALPTVDPLTFRVEVREDNGVGYWTPEKAGRNTGILEDDGAFRFTLSSSRVVSQDVPGRTSNLEPEDFQTLKPDFDLMARSTCAVTTNEVVEGSVERRYAADGGAIVNVDDDAGASDDADLSGDDTITVTPTAGSDCNMALAALGGSFLALPCTAHYKLHGSLSKP